MQLRCARLGCLGSGHGGETYGAFPTRPLASAFMLRHPIALEGVLGGEVVGESWGG